ncbi:hypothetical protein AB4Z54_18320, partial [Streptomyces sp. MCAF7]
MARRRKAAMAGRWARVGPLPSASHGRPGAGLIVPGGGPVGRCARHRPAVTAQLLLVPPPLSLPPLRRLSRS